MNSLKTLVENEQWKTLEWERQRDKLNARVAELEAKNNDLQKQVILLREEKHAALGRVFILEKAIRGLYERAKTN